MGIISVADFESGLTMLESTFVESLSYEMSNSAGLRLAKADIPGRKEPQILTGKARMESQMPQMMRYEPGEVWQSLCNVPSDAYDCLV